MAKTTKESDQKKKTAHKIRNGKIGKRHNEFKFRDCFDKIKKMTDKEIEKNCNSHHTITKTFSMKLSDKQLGFDNKKYCSDSNTFNFELKMSGSDLVLGCRNVAEITGHQQKVVEQEVIGSSAIQKIEKVTPFAKPLNSLINEAWTKCKNNFKKTNQSIEIGSLVLAKMKGYSSWPARVEDFTKNKKRAKVFFFGSSNCGTVDAIEIVPFEECSDIIRLLLLRKIGEFHRGIVEIERVLGVPPELSLTNELFSIKN